MNLVLLAMGLGALAVSTVSSPATGSGRAAGERMRDIAAAIQEGRAGLSQAAIYHHRDCRRRCGDHHGGSLGHDSAPGFVLGAVLSGAAGSSA
jgi:Na+/H+-translocating membrane pyrophosphatase